MENLILWGFPVIIALFGLRNKLFKSYILLLNVVFAIYLALWSEGLFSSFYNLPGVVGQYKSAITLLSCAVAAVFLLFKLVDQLMPEEQEFTFPALADKLGGGVCGFLAGVAIINFVAFLFCTTPQKALAAEFVSVQALEQACTGNLVTLTAVLDNLIFQKAQQAQRAEKLEKLVRKSDPPPAEEPKKEDSKETGTPAAAESSNQASAPSGRPASR